MTIRIFATLESASSLKRIEHETSKNNSIAGFYNQYLPDGMQERSPGLKAAFDNRRDSERHDTRILEDGSHRADGIVPAPLDDVALRRPVDEAMSNGIFVVIFDSGTARG